MRKTSHRIVFSSSWSRVKQAAEADIDWQFQALWDIENPRNRGQTLYGATAYTISYSLIESVRIGKERPRTRQLY